jgi:SAM-dependent methyltransferase
MWLRIAEKALRRVAGKHFAIVPRKREGVLRHGTFTDVDFRDHEVVDKTKALVLEKGKYKVSVRDNDHGQASSAGLAVVDNSKASFDGFWRNDAMVREYLGQARQQFYDSVVEACGDYLHGRVIDVGCGPGSVLKALAPHGSIQQVYGVDFSGSAIERCREEVPTGMFLKGDIYHLGCRDQTFDLVFCMETLEHLECATTAIEELFRICRIGGHVIITIPNGARDEYVGHMNFWTEQDFRGALGGREMVNFQYFQDGMSMMFVVKRTW